MRILAQKHEPRGPGGLYLSGVKEGTWEISPEMNHTIISTTCDFRLTKETSGYWLWSQITWVQILVLPLLVGDIGEMKHSLLQSSYLDNGDDNSSHLIEF